MTDIQRAATAAPAAGLQRVLLRNLLNNKQKAQFPAMSYPGS